MTSKVFHWTLKAAGIFILGAGAMHIVLGANADVLLGAQVSSQSLMDAGLDSQNRFYGATFTLYGVLLLLVTRDLQRYGPVLRCLLWVFWGAGLVRFISVALYGWPPLLMNLLFALEVVLPPLLLAWHAKLAPQEADAPAP